LTALSELIARADARAAQRLHSVADARRAARRRLPTVVFDYVDGAADDEVTMRRNEEAFTAVEFRPKMASGMTEPRLATSVLGRSIELPVLLAPCGLVRLLHPDGAAGVARAADTRGTVSVLSTVAGTAVEAVAGEASTPLWFQLYAAGGLPEADTLCERAAGAGAEALVVTVDTPVLGNRERDVRHGVAPPLRVDAHNVVPLGAQVLARPRWAVQLGATGIRLSRRGAGPSGHGSGMLSAVASPFSWDDVAHLRTRWRGPLVVKGILSGDDARRAVDCGADALVVSNHGGRQLDGAPATLRALPGVVSAVGGHAEVLVDGGIRRGSHVVAALCLGARAVMIGRPYLYGLAAAGELGVERILDILGAEMRRTMVLMGCTSVDELGQEWLEIPAG
jgi:isopentenyl diphosphate isomerase/L-lactate dehydrogenase-like FMN-dependent dehydrogenase